MSREITISNCCTKYFCLIYKYCINYVKLKKKIKFCNKITAAKSVTYSLLSLKFSNFIEIFYKRNFLY